MTFWRKFLLPLFDPDSTLLEPYRDDRPAPPPMRHWAVPMTITECGTITDGLHAFDLAIRSIAYGETNGSPSARHRASLIAQQVGAAHAHGYLLVPIDTDWLPDLEHLLNEMLARTVTRDLPATTAYANAVRHAQVYAGMAPVKGWALNRKYGTEWLNGEPRLPTQTTVDLKVTPPSTFPRF